MRGVSIRGAAKCSLWARIFSQLASVGLSGNPVNEQQNEGKTPTKVALTTCGLEQEMPGLCWAGSTPDDGSTSRGRGKGDKDKLDLSQAVHFSVGSLLNCSYFIFLNAAACPVRAG